MDIDRLIPRSWDYVVRLIEQDSERAFLWSVSVILLIVALYVWFRVEVSMGRLRNGRKFWRGKMSSEDREACLVADAITDALERLWEEGKITLRQRNRWYARLGRKHKLVGLFPRKRKIKGGHLIHLKDMAARGLEALKKEKVKPIPDKPSIPTVIVRSRKPKTA